MDETISMQKATPKAKSCIRLCTASVTRHTGAAVRPARCGIVARACRHLNSNRDWRPLGYYFVKAPLLLQSFVHDQTLQPAGTQHYAIVNAVAGLPSGSYVFHPQDITLELLQAGDFRLQAGELALGQELAADASVTVFVLCDVLPVVERFGNRGYRAAQLEAGIMGGRMYLAAYAQGFGATGLTFFDDDVTAFFSPHAAEKSVMFLIALGYATRRR